MDERLWNVMGAAELAAYHAAFTPDEVGFLPRLACELQDIVADMIAEAIMEGIRT